jgi:cysteine-S-conjugate beta-lyase
MTYDFDNPPDRRNTDSVKWRLYGPDVLPLWVADMDFPSPVPVIQALRERVEHGIYGYPEGIKYGPKELTNLRWLVIERLNSLYGWQIEPEDLILMPGVATGFNLACHSESEPDGEVIVQTPIYPPILRAPGYAGMQLKQQPLSIQESGYYEIDWDAYEAAFSEKTRLFILCNPHNPVGRVFRKDELERMADICIRNGTTICSDEIHCDLIFSGHEHIPIASLDDEIAQKTITLIAPTKTFNLAGLKISFSIIQNPEIRRRYIKAQKGLVSWTNIMGVTAARAAYSHGQDWLSQLIPYLETNRNVLKEFVDTNLHEIRMVNPEGTYLAWLDCRTVSPGPLKDDPFKFFLEKARVALNDGREFGIGGEGFVRLNFGCPRGILMKALEKMEKETLLQIS